MMKKHFFIFILLISSIVSSSAQNEQGRWMVIGALDTDLSLDNDDDASEFLLSLGLGKFIVDRFAVGGNWEISYKEAGNIKSTDFSIGPFARWYVLGGGNLQMFIQTDIDYTYRSINGNKSNGFGVFGGPGLSYFFSDNVSIDVLLGYNYRTFGKDATSENIRLLAGFQIYL